MLAGAAALGASSPAWAAAQPGDLAQYLKARAAAAAGDVAVAASSYAAALDAAPTNPVIAVRAYRAALDAGDYALADRAAGVLLQAGVAPPDAALPALAGAIHAGDKRAAAAAIDRLDDTALDFMAPVLKAWQAFDDGGKDPIAALKTGASNPLGRRYAAENRALLLIATGKTDDGVAAVRALLAPDQGSFDFRVAAAQLLAAKGKGDLARALLSGDDPVLSAFREKLGDGTAPSLAFGASRLFDRLAADLAHDDPSPLSIVLARSALRIDPHDDRARLLVAQTLAAQDATALALAALDGIDPAGPYAAVARAARVAVLDDAGDAQQALAAAAKLDGASNATAADAQRYGDALVKLDRFADAAKAYDRAIDRAGAAADWTMYLQKGGALDEAGDWPAAHQALRKAVSLAPDEPLALNYLGYASIEHNEDLAAAQKLLETASALKPGDPAITDSLGWAYFQRGDSTRALPLFERAAEGQPADVTINEHLGDAYWRAGRHFEARYAWRAAAVNADPGDKTRSARQDRERARPRPGQELTRVIVELAPAKINLALHVRSRRADGYHAIETLFAFLRHGDEICVELAAEGSFTVTGPFAPTLAGEGGNLVLAAYDAFAARIAPSPPLAITLDKRLPVASGIGGGSADAAAMLRVMARLNDVELDDPRLLACAAELGADVPACLFGRTAIGTGTGADLNPITINGLADLPVLLVNPGVAVSTATVFRAWDGIDRGVLATGDPLAVARAGRNDLEPAARRLVPEIDAVLAALAAAHGVTLTRMSGSGATCFALFECVAARSAAAQTIATAHPDWWLLASTLV